MNSVLCLPARGAQLTNYADTGGRHPRYPLENKSSGLLSLILLSNAPFKFIGREESKRLHHSNTKLLSPSQANSSQTPQAFRQMPLKATQVHVPLNRALIRLERPVLQPPAFYGRKLVTCMDRHYPVKRFAFAQWRTVRISNLFATEFIRVAATINISANYS